MKWEKEMECKLKEYPYKRNALFNLEDRINYLNSTMYGLGASYRDREPVQGGGNKAESQYINRIVEKMELEKNLENIRNDLEWIEKGLECLDPIEKKVIDSFYLTEYKVSKEKLAQEMGYNKQHLYKIKDQAIYKMTLHLYGCLTT